MHGALILQAEGLSSIPIKAHIPSVISVVLLFVITGATTELFFHTITIYHN